MSVAQKLPNIENDGLKSQFVGLDDEPLDTKCMLCDKMFTLPTHEEIFLTHLFKEHRLVIGDVRKIASLKSYARYWNIKFKEEPLTNFCSTLLMDCKPDGTPSTKESYFLLSDCIFEDKTLREEIHRAKLEWVLNEQAKERNDKSFKRGCIFCRTEITGCRSSFVQHLSQKHNFQIGRPENLVFLDKLFDKIQNYIENLICIYCEKVFKDRTVLKEHMRKKLHKRINPNNTTFDRFYINNYLKPGGMWRRKQSDRERREDVDDVSTDEEDQETWSDWNGESCSINCLFCDFNNVNFLTVLGHMKTEHNFNFEEVSRNLTFYQKVKIVNYIRKQMHLNKCVFCNTEVDNVIQHMWENGHCKLPPLPVWDDVEFYFSVHENDPFLYNLEMEDDSDDDESEVQNVKEQMSDL